jgi:hypothetical protein
MMVKFINILTKFQTFKLLKNNIKIKIFSYMN